MNDQLYREIVLDHYKNPRNEGEVSDPQVRQKLANYSCGDEIELSIEVENGVLKDIKHKTSGCAISVAGASLLSEYVLNKKIEKILEIDEKKMQELAGITVTPSRMKCLMLALEALKRALEQLATA